MSRHEAEHLWEQKSQSIAPAEAGSCVSSPRQCMSCNKVLAVLVWVIWTRLFSNMTRSKGPAVYVLQFDLLNMKHDLHEEL